MKPKINKDDKIILLKAAIQMHNWMKAKIREQQEFNYDAIVSLNRCGLCWMQKQTFQINSKYTHRMFLDVICYVNNVYIYNGSWTWYDEPDNLNAWYKPRINAINNTIIWLLK